MTTLLAAALTLGLATGTAFAEDPEPTPSASASQQPTSEPTQEPTSEPTSEPTQEPTSEPTQEPTSEPTSEPTQEPTSEPTQEPTTEPTQGPTLEPTLEPTPGDPNPQQTVEPADTGGRGGIQIDMEGLFAACRSLGLGSGCVDYTAPERLLEVATAAADKCLTGGVCAVARDVAVDAITVAATCVGRVVRVHTGGWEEVGPTAGPLDINCGTVVPIAYDVVYLALTEGERCATRQTASCETVYDAAAHALNTAAGCAGGVGSAAGVDMLEVAGTDPGCAGAVYAVQDVGAGLLALLGKCFNGGDVCDIVMETAGYYLDAATGCVGELVVAGADAVATPWDQAPTCYAVVDQANQSLNAWLHRLRPLPNTISPTNDCSITVGVPVHPDLADGTDTDLVMLVPPCDEPVQYLTLDTPPAPSLSAGPDPDCGEYKKEFIVPDKGRTQDWLGVRLEKDHINHNVKDARHKFSMHAEASAEMSWGSSVEGEASMVLATVKAKVETRITLKFSMGMQWEVDHGVPPHTRDVVQFGVRRKVIKGYFRTQWSNCKVEIRYVTVRGPYRLGTDGYQEPA